MTGRSLILALAAACGFAQAAHAQPPQRVERLLYVVAIVGDSVISSVDLNDAVRQTIAGGQIPAPTDSAGLRQLQRDVLEGMIDQLLVFQAALRDTTVKVTDEEVEAAVDKTIEQIKQQMGGDVPFQARLAEANITLQALRAQHAQRHRRDITTSRFFSKLRGDRKPPPVTEEEIKAYFEENRAVIGTRPPTITYRQVVLPVQPSDSTLAALRTKIDSILQLARSGEDFALLARRFSDDPSARELGGDLGFQRLGMLVPEFERALFSQFVRPGEIIGPVRTLFGLHLIKLETIRGSERKARHILLRPTLTDADKERTRLLADSIAAKIKAGADIDSIAAAVGESGVPVRMGPEARDSSPDAYKHALADATVGQVVGPFTFEGPADIPRWVVVKVMNLEEGRPATVDDFREQIEQTLAQRKLQDELIQELRRKTYIEIRLGRDPGGGVPR
jgi:parvulin-like peptidyl-prolyl isomerase